MSDNANPLKTYHERQLQDQAQPVRLYGENGGAPQVQLSGSSAWQTSQAYVGTTAAQLAATPLAGRSAVKVRCIGPGNLFVGEDDGVSAATGDMLTPGEFGVYPLDSSAEVWAVSDDANCDVRVTEVS